MSLDLIQYIELNIIENLRNINNNKISLSLIVKNTLEYNIFLYNIYMTLYNRLNTPESIDFYNIFDIIHILETKYDILLAYNIQSKYIKILYLTINYSIYSKNNYKYFNKLKIFLKPLIDTNCNINLYVHYEIKKLYTKYIRNLDTKPINAIYPKLIINTKDIIINIKNIVYILYLIHFFDNYAENEEYISYSSNIRMLENEYKPNYLKNFILKLKTRYSIIHKTWLSAVYRAIIFKSLL